METVTLNDGTVLTGHILEEGDRRSIFVYLDGLTITEGFPLLSDSSKTKRITSDSYGHHREYEGYVILSSISGEFGNCNAVLRRS